MKKSTSTCAVNAQGGESLLFWGVGKNRPETSFRSLLRLRPLASGDTPSTGGGTGTPIMPRTIEFQLIWRY